MLALAELAGQLAVEEGRHRGFHRARTDRIGRDQAVDDGLDQRGLDWREEHIPLARSALRRIGGALDPGNLAADRLGVAAQFAVMA